MKWIKDRIIWLVPVAIILVALSIMFIETITLVSDPPSDNWSREYEVGKAQINKIPLIDTQDDKINMYFYEEEKKMIKQKVFNLDFKELSSKTIPVTFTAWEDFYIDNDQNLYYFEKGTIYKGKEEVAKADHFYPLIAANKIVFSKDQAVYAIDVKSGNVSEMFTTDQPIRELVISSDSTIDSVLVYHVANKIITSSIYQQSGGIYQRVSQNKIEIPFTEFFDELTYASKDNQFTLAYTTKGAQRGRSKLRLYILQSTFEKAANQANQITPLDPVTSSPLTDVSSIHADYVHNKLSLLFKGYGYSYKDSQTQYAFNIYELTDNNGKYEVNRRSNTYSLSTSPFRINANTVGWLELHGQQNDVLISSSNQKLIDKTVHINFTDLLLTTGVILTKISTSTFTLYLTYPWFVTVILFFVLLFYLKRRSLDMDSPWMTNAGILIYLATAILLKGHFFVHTIYEQAPKYLTFSGSSWFYIFFFAVIAYIATKLIDKEYGPTFRVSYFIGLHILMLMVFFGPYIY